MSALRKTSDERDQTILPPVHSERSAKLMRAMGDANDPDAIIHEVNILWNNVKQNFLVIGQYLMRARDVIRAEISTHPDAGDITGREMTARAARAYQERVLSNLPFQRSTALQLEAVARAVFVDKRFDTQELPTSYSTSYLLASLTDSQLKKARNHGVVHPDVTRSEVQKFKTAIMRPVVDAQSDYEILVSRKERISRELSVKQNEIALLQQELVSIEMRLNALEKE